MRQRQKPTIRKTTFRQYSREVYAEIDIEFTAEDVHELAEELGINIPDVESRFSNEILEVLKAVDRKCETLAGLMEMREYLKLS